MERALAKSTGAAHRRRAGDDVAQRDRRLPPPTTDWFRRLRQLRWQRRWSYLVLHIVVVMPLVVVTGVSGSAFGKLTALTMYLRVQ